MRCDVRRSLRLMWRILTSVPQGVLLHLGRSKTDQHGKGELVAIHRGTNSEFCAVTALERWIETRSRKPGPLFTRLHQGRPGERERLRPQAVALVVKRAALASGLNPDSFSGHSLRADWPAQPPSPGPISRTSWRKPVIARTTSRFAISVAPKSGRTIYSTPFRSGFSALTLRSMLLRD